MVTLPRNVTKVQLPLLYLRNLDKVCHCATLDNGPLPATGWETCPRPPQGAVSGSLTIYSRASIGAASSRLWTCESNEPEARSRPSLVTRFCSISYAKYLWINILQHKSAQAIDSKETSTEGEGRFVRLQVETSPSPDLYKCLRFKIMQLVPAVQYFTAKIRATR